MTALGTHFTTTADGRLALRFDRTFAHPPKKVWRALTEAEHLRHWFPAAVDFDLTPGAKVRFEIRTDAKQHYDIPDDQAISYGEVIAVEAPHLLEYAWEEEILRWELQTGGKDGCRLIFTHVLDRTYTTPAASEVAAGWHVGFEMLTAQLDGQAIQRSPWERQAQILTDYAQSFG